MTFTLFVVLIEQCETLIDLNELLIVTDARHFDAGAIRRRYCEEEMGHFDGGALRRVTNGRG